MKAYFENLSRSFKDLNFIYDEQQTHETALTAYRSQYTSSEEGKNPYPLLAWSREAIGKVPDKLRYIKAKSSFVEFKDDSGVCYEGYFGRLTLPFTIFSNDSLQLERLEVAYMAEQFMSNILTMDYELSDINIDRIPLQLTYIDWESRETSIEGAFYQSLKSTFYIDGWFLSASSTVEKLQQLNINFRVSPSLDLSSKTEVTSSLPLVPTSTEIII